MLESGKFDGVVLTCEFEKKVEMIHSKIPKFGSLSAMEIKSQLYFENAKVQQAQLVGSPVKLININDIKYKLIDTVHMDARDVVGCDMFSDGRMIFCDYMDDNLKLIDMSISKVFIPIHLVYTSPFDVTVINDTTVAVTFVDGNSVVIVDVKTKEIKRNIPITGCGNLFGIVYTNELLLICKANEGINAVNIDTGQINSLVKHNLPEWACVTHLKNKLYYTTYTNNTVHCCDMAGKELWAFEDTSILKEAWGITVDNFGNVYVVGRSTSNVVFISMDGKQSRQFLSQKDGLNDPRTIQYDRTRNRLLVVNKANALLFDIS